VWALFFFQYVIEKLPTKNMRDTEYIYEYFYILNIVYSHPDVAASVSRIYIRPRIPGWIYFRLGFIMTMYEQYCYYDNEHKSAQ
jgi:hypothetical protein